MLWGCVASTGTADLVKVEGHMNSSQYQQILDKNVQESVTKLKLRRDWIFQQDNDPKHCSKSTKEFMQKHKYNLLEWPSQSPDLNIIENVWIDLKQAVNARKPRNLTELEAFCMEEWAKTPDFRDLSVAIGGVYRLFLQQKEAQLNINGIMSMGCPNLSTCLFLFICTQKCFFWTNKNDFTTEMFLFS